MRNINGVKLKKYEELLNNGAFCIMPWVHVHGLPSGETKACCLIDDKYITGSYRNLNTSSIAEVLNSEAHKALRVKMLNGEKDQSCRVCFDRTKTFRTYANGLFDQDLMKDLIENHTHIDGTIDKIDLKYIDIRFSNLCNLKCRTCYEDLSSSWHEENVAANGPNGRPKFVSTDSFGKLEQHLPSVERIYFAGGEPLMSPDHYKILDWLIANDRTNIELVYNTNLSFITYKSKSLIDYWKHFPKLTIAASIDGMGAEVEYVRTNIDWEVYRKNFETVKAAGIKIYPGLTISIMNASHLIDFIRYCIENDWISQEVSSNINFVDYPQYFCIRNFPQWYKDELTKKYLELKDWLNSKGYEIYSTNIDMVLTYISSPGDITLLEKGFDRLDYYDKLNKTNWKLSLPGLAEFYTRHKS